MNKIGPTTEKGQIMNNVQEDTGRQLSSAGKTLAVLYLPIVLIAALFVQCAEASNANIAIDAAIARYIWYGIIAALAVHPCICLARNNLGKKKRDVDVKSEGKEESHFHAGKLFLIAVIVTSHIVTLIAWKNGEITYDKMVLLLIYDLILIGTYGYWQSARNEMYQGLLVLDVLLWLSALYGIAEHFWFASIPHLYSDISNGQRIIAVFVNSIPASSIWLMGMWLPFPGRKQWFKAAAKITFVLAIFFTGTKNAWGGLALSAVVFVCLNGKGLRKAFFSMSRRWKVTMVLITIALVIAAFFVGEYGVTIMKRWKDVQTQGSFLARWQHIQDTVKHMIYNTRWLNRIFGYGYATSWQFVEDSPHYYGLNVRCIDNQYFTSFFEFGLLSLAAIIVWGRNILSHLKIEEPFARGSAYGLLAMLIPLACYDPFRWKLIMAVFLPLSMITQSGEWVSFNGKHFVRLLTLLVIGTGSALFFFPKAIRGLRTVSQIVVPRLHLPVSVRTLEIILWAGCFAIVLILLVLLWRIIEKLQFGIKLGKTGTVFIIGTVVFAIGTIICSLALQRAKALYKPVMDQEASAIEAITASNTGVLYVDEYPSVYQLRFGGVGGSLFYGEKIIPADATTIVVNKDYESKTLLDKGFLFTQISDHHAVYTDDPGVTAALQQMGLLMTGYYSVEHTLQTKSWTEPAMISSEEAIAQTIVIVQHLQLTPTIYTVQIDGTFLQMEGKDSDENKNTGWLLTVIDEATGRRLFQKEVKPMPAVKEKITFTAPSGKGRNNAGMVSIKLEGVYDFSDAKWSIVSRQTPKYDIHYLCDYSDRVIGQEYYNLDGVKVMNQEGYHRISYSYDRRTDPVERCYWDVNDKLIVTNGGYAIVKSKFKKHRAIREAYYNANRKKTVLPYGHFIEERSFDEKGRLVTRKYRNTKKELMLITAGYAEIHYAYNDLDQVISETYYDVDGNPIMLSSGYAGVLFERDASGKILKQICCDSEGEPVLNSTGYASLTREYDKWNQIEEEAYFGTNGQLKDLASGYAIEKREYDEVGNLIARKYFDCDGNPTVHNGGYSEIHYIYDEDRIMTAEYYFDKDGQSTVIPGGRSGYVFERDSEGNICTYRYVDDNGNLVMNTSGYAQLCREYDQNRQIVREYYLDLVGHPVTCSSGYAEIRREYNARHQMIREAYFDLNREPYICGEGYSEYRIEYSKDGTWDVLKYYNANGELITLQSQYAQIQRYYNNQKQKIRDDFLDLDGNLVLTTGGYASRDWEYDAMGNLVVLSCFDTRRKPVVTSSGACSQIREYNDRKQEIREKYYDEKGNPVLLPSGYSMIEWSRSDTGYPIEERYYGLENELVQRKEGYAKVVREYDSAGCLILEQKIDIFGNVIDG